MLAGYPLQLVVSKPAYDGDAIILCTACKDRASSSNATLDADTRAAADGALSLTSLLSKAVSVSISADWDVEFICHEDDLVLDPEGKPIGLTISESSPEDAQAWKRVAFIIQELTGIHRTALVNDVYDGDHVQTRESPISPRRHSLTNTPLHTVRGLFADHPDIVSANKTAYNQNANFVAGVSTHSRWGHSQHHNHNQHQHHKHRMHHNFDDVAPQSWFHKMMRKIRSK
jgi:hypothetical protein